METDKLHAEMEGIALRWGRTFRRQGRPSRDGTVENIVVHDPTALRAATGEEPSEREWVKGMIQRAHTFDGPGPVLPDDWIYETVSDALDRLAEALSYGEDLDDAASSFADGQVDIYTNDRARWVAGARWRMGVCDLAAEEWGVPVKGANLSDSIAQGQYYTAEHVFRVVREAVENYVLNKGV